MKLRRLIATDQFTRLLASVISICFGLLLTWFFGKK